METIVRATTLLILITMTTTGCGLRESQTTSEQITSPENTSYRIDGKTVTLVNGTASTPAAPGSSSSITTVLFEANTRADINNDGREDRIVILTQNTGGSGTFYYAAAALGTEKGYTGTNTILLGDRIAPQSMSVVSGTIHVNYADRKPGENFTVPPSEGKTLYAVYKNGQLTAVAP